MKRIMLLGYSPALQIMLTNAKKHGYYVIVCCDHDTVKVENADKVYQVGTNEYEKILNIAREEKIDGIASNRDDCMVAVAYVASALGLVGNSPDSVSRLQDKYLFRRLQKEIGVFCPNFAIIEDTDDLLRKAAGFKYPVIVKPCMSSGSRGVNRIDAYNEKELIDVYNDCKSFSRNGKVMIEEYVPRPLTNLECDVFVHNDTYLWVGYETNHCAPEKPMQPRGGMFPADETDDNKAKFEQAVKKLFSKAGIRHGVYNIEAIFTEDNVPFIIEINARMAGSRIPEVILKHSDIDVYNLLISTSVGDDSYFEFLINNEWPCRYITNFELFPYKDGIFTGFYIDRSIQNYIYDTIIWGEIGSHVSPTKNAGDSLGMIFLEYPDRELQKRTLLELPKLIYPIVE